MNPRLDAQHVLWYPRDIVQRMEPQRARAARLMLRDIDKTDLDGTRWFLVSKSVWKVYRSPPAITSGISSRRARATASHFRVWRRRRRRRRMPRS